MYNIVARPAESVANGVPITLHKNHPKLRSRRKKERAGACLPPAHPSFLASTTSKRLLPGHNHPGKNLVHKHKTLEFGVLGEQPATRYIQITWTYREE